MIEGYSDAIITEVNGEDLYSGGDRRVSSTVGVTKGPRAAHITLLSGEDSQPSETRRVASYEPIFDGVKTQDSPFILLPKQAWVSPTESVYELDGPNGYTERISGTDGAQFSPDLSPDEPIAFFQPEWARNVYLDYLGQDNEFKELETLKYAMDGLTTSN